jgi:hypothetical protein
MHVCDVRLLVVCEQCCEALAEQAERLDPSVAACSCLECPSMAAAVSNTEREVSVQPSGSNSGGCWPPPALLQDVGMSLESPVVSALCGFWRTFLMRAVQHMRVLERTPADSSALQFGIARYTQRLLPTWLDLVRCGACSPWLTTLPGRVFCATCLACWFCWGVCGSCDGFVYLCAALFAPRMYVDHAWTYAHAARLQRMLKSECRVHTAMPGR